MGSRSLQSNAGTEDSEDQAKLVGDLRHVSSTNGVSNAKDVGRSNTGEDRVSQQGCESANLSQPTGRRESANRKARVSQQEGASQPTGRRESANQGGASQTTRSRVTRSRVRQPGRESDNRSRVSQPGRESANQVASQPTRSRVSQPGRASANQVASQTSRSRVRQPGRTQDMKRKEMK